MTAIAQFTPHRFYSAQEIAHMRGGKETRKGEFQCKCPAHEDRVASLSVGTGRNGDTLIDCKAGCDKRLVVRALGLEWKNLFREPRSNSNGSPYRPTTARPVKTKERKQSQIDGLTHPTLGKPDDIYPYTNESGNLVYVSVRFTKPEKSFRQAQPDGEGGWRWSLSGIEPLPFHLPELIEAVAEERLIAVVEGEKDVLNLEAVGIPATTNSGGAKKFPVSAVKYFAGAHVAILGDNDQPGQEHAQIVAALLHASARSVTVVNLPGLPEKGDVSDWLAAGGTTEQLLALISADEEPPKPLAARRLRLTDDEELMSLEDPGWLNEGRIPKNATAQLFGESGTYKSFVALDLACHIALGMDWHGTRVSQGNVVYVCAEGVHGMKHRVAGWKKYHGVEGKLGLYFLRHGIELKRGSADMRELLAEMKERVIPPPVLIVIDTLARNIVGNENAAEDMSAYVKGCDMLRESTGATVFSVHHSGYGEADRGRGSSSNRGAMDTDIQCLRDGDRVTLRNQKQKDAAEFADISFEAISVGKSLVLKPMDQLGGKLDGNRLLCLRAVHRVEGGATHSHWMKEAELDKKKSSFNAARTWLQAAAYVKQGVGGKYLITDAGKMALGPQSISGPQLVHSAEVQSGPSRGGMYIPPDGLDPLQSPATEAS